ncbi:MAG: methyltransferase domain-containing protein [Spirochaetia bacterium]|jgi:SAM-dependent methyltransferase|nr:methyltransferase domain-containing protein [Spirochaetia bacterium]
MLISDIDWNEAAAEIARGRTKMDTGTSLKGDAYWDMRAPSFAKHADETGYAEAFINIIKPDKSMTVFDMGCGGGTLAIPMAGLVSEITAADFSEKMLNIVKSKSEQYGIKNIRALDLSWAGDWSGAGIGVYDIAISSRSMSVDNISEAVTKLSSAASKRVYISTIVKDGPLDRRIYEAVGRKVYPSVDYIYIYNILYQMGIHANVSFIKESDVKSYGSFSEALDSCRWMLQEMTPDEEAKLAAFMKEHLEERDGRWIKNYAQKYKWAVIWWEKE